MISLMIFMLVMGLIVFGPKKTIEMAQTMGRAVAQMKGSLNLTNYFDLKDEGSEETPLTSSPRQYPIPEAGPPPQA